MSEKDKKIAFHSNSIRVHNDDIKRASLITKTPFTSIKIFNGSCTEEELIVPVGLKEELQRFIIGYFEAQKTVEYFELEQALKMND